MLVVAPLIIIVVAVIIGFMVSLVGNVAVANTRTQVLYDMQDALNQIEQDTFFSTAFIGPSYTPPSPQGKNNDTTPFNPPNDIIISQPGLSSNPTDSTREMAFYANRPNACSGNYKINEQLYVTVIYFVKNNTLYRRVVVPTWNNNSTPDSNTVCKPVWQRGSCASGITGTGCLTKDAAILTNVDSLSMTVAYYKKSAPSTPITSDLSNADSLKVTLTASTKAGGETISNTSELAASRPVN